MKITDVISITELSRLLKKSRPTVYKYVFDFESGNVGQIPHSVKKLFEEIQTGAASKREICEYCTHWFGEAEEPKGFLSLSQLKDRRATLKEIIKLLNLHERKLDLAKIKNFIEQEIQK